MKANRVTNFGLLVLVAWRFLFGRVGCGGVGRLNELVQGGVAAEPNRLPTAKKVIDAGHGFIRPLPRGCRRRPRWR